MRSTGNAVLVAFGLASVLAGCGREAASPGNRSRADSGTSDVSGAVGSESGEQLPGDDKEPSAVDPPDVTPTAWTNAFEGPHPFPRRVAVPEFPDDLEWLNSKPLKLKDLEGKFVLLDFWTYCCINCMHILPELKKLENVYADQLVVIGVHSAKFDSEKVSDNIAAAILRYEIAHPVMNDRNHAYWERVGVSSWPTVLLIDPEGKAIWGRAGEIRFSDVDEVLKKAIPYYRGEKLLDETPLRFELLAHRAGRSPLSFPGKVLADEAGDRLFISDSNHNRIVVTTLDGRLQTIIGSGRIGRKDGASVESEFHHPQGMALHGDTLFVADTENHLLRKVDLKDGFVSTIAGIGSQAESAFPGFDPRSPSNRGNRRWVGKPKRTAINSPWDLWVHGTDLFIAMAGPHQVWRMPLDESTIGPYAGNGREDIVDGALLPPRPYELGSSSFAQPSGLASDGTSLFVADSEGSSIRAVPLDEKGAVRTVVGTSHLPYARLFQFGDQDGARDAVKLQHCLAVLYHDNKLYVADTYNNKIKMVDPQSGATQTLAGTGEPGSSDGPAQFFEPAGLAMARGTLYVADTNNHSIRTIDLSSGTVATLAIAGLEPPPSPAPRKPAFDDAARVRLKPVTVRPENGSVRLTVELAFPQGWKLNDEAPLEVWIEGTGEGGPWEKADLNRREIAPAAPRFDLPVRATGAGTGPLTVAAVFYYCETDGALCKAASVIWELPITVANDGSADSPVLAYTAPAANGR